MESRRRLGLQLIAVTIVVVFIASTYIVLSRPKEQTEQSISVEGLVENTLAIDLSDLESKPSITVTAELICVSEISLGTHNWTGVKLKDILNDAGVQAEAVKVAFTASDYYTTDLTLQDAMRDDVIVAYLEDGSPIAEKTRLVVPGKWGYKWISDLVKIELVDYDFLGKWESRGYSDEATISL